MNWALNLLLGILSFAISLAWIFLLFKLGQSRKRTTLFFVLLYAPAVLSTLITAIIAAPALPTIFAGLYGLVGLWIIIIVVFLLMERIAWGITLKEISGEDQLVWFYIAYAIPLFGWLLYHITKLR